MLKKYYLNRKIKQGGCPDLRERDARRRRQFPRRRLQPALHHPGDGRLRHACRRGRRHGGRDEGIDLSRQGPAHHLRTGLREN